MDYLLNPKEKLKESLKERILTIKKILNKYGDNKKILIKNSDMVELREALVLALNYLAIANSDKAKEDKDLIIQKLAYIRENKILTLDQYKEACNILERVLSE
jgi:phosphotransacetylase